MFALREPDDRMKMVKLLRFKDVKEAYDRYSDLPKQHAVIKTDNEYAREVITPPVENTYVPYEVLEAYMRERLKDPWYLSKGDIEKQIAARIKQPADDTTRDNSLSPKKRAISDSETVIYTPQAGRKTLLDLGPEAEQFIRNNKAPQGHGEEGGAEE